MIAPDACSPEGLKMEVILKHGFGFHHQVVSQRGQEIFRFSPGLKYT